MRRSVGASSSIGGSSSVSTRQPSGRPPSAVGSPDRNTAADELDHYKDRRDDVVAWVMVNFPELTDAFADWVGDTVEKALSDEPSRTGSAKSGHYFCSIVGAAAASLVQIAGLGERLQEMVETKLIAGGRPPLAAKMVGLLAKHALEAHVTASLKQVTVALCAIAVAMCPNPQPSSHGNRDILSCENHLDGAIATEVVKQRLELDPASK